MARCPAQPHLHRRSHHKQTNPHSDTDKDLGSDEDNYPSMASAANVPLATVSHVQMLMKNDQLRPFVPQTADPAGEEAASAENH